MKKAMPHPSRPLANSRHETFAQDIFSGMTGADAYRKTYPASLKWAESAIYAKASHLLHSDKVGARVEWLKSQVASSKILTKARALEILTECAEASMADYTTCSADGVWFHDYGKDKQRHRAVKRIKSKTIAGNDDSQAILIELELESKTAAIERIAKLLGWDKETEKNANETGVTVNITIPYNDKP